MKMEFTKKELRAIQSKKDDRFWGLEIAKSMYVSMCRKAICAT